MAHIRRGGRVTLPITFSTLATLLELLTLATKEITKITARA